MDEDKRIELYKNIFVQKGELNKILNHHAKKTGENIINQLKPELKNIDKRLQEGYERFEKHDGEIEDIKLKMARQNGEKSNPGNPGDNADATITIRFGNHLKRNAGKYGVGTGLLALIIEGIILWISFNGLP